MRLKLAAVALVVGLAGCALLLLVPTSAGRAACGRLMSHFQHEHVWLLRAPSVTAWAGPEVAFGTLVVVATAAINRRRIYMVGVIVMSLVAAFATASVIVVVVAPHDKFRISALPDVFILAGAVAAARFLMKSRLKVATR